MPANGLDALLLSRLQFAANISFHILFPAITIGLGWVLLYFRLRYRATRDPAWERAYGFWTKVFALSFAMGVVSGVTMSFQFGTNWPGFMETVGNIAGPLLGYEVLTAFFLEATFLGVMLFGKDRVSEGTHLVATFLVALGTTFSAFWILALNSWMQTPAGHVISGGRYFADDWWAIIFNPSFPYRFVHMVLASFLTGAFLIAGLSAWQMLKGVADAASAKALRTAVTLAAVLVPIQIFAGDQHGLNTQEHQPAKIAAVEALWETRADAPLVLLAWPDEAARTNRYALEIPGGASLILKHSRDGVVRGLNEFGDAHPPVPALFWAFRVMVGVGVLMLLAAWAAALALWRGRALGRPMLWTLAAMTFSGWVATLAGWYVTEIGRQPWMVYGLLRTADVVARHAAPTVGATLVGYLLLYAVLLVAYVAVLKYLAEKPALTEKPLQGAAPGAGATAAQH